MSPLILNIRRPVYRNTIYLDKDGVLNVALWRDGKLSSPRLIEEIIIKKDLNDILTFSDKRFNLVIVSNQPDLSRGLISEEFIEKNVQMISKHLPIHQALFCPHTKDLDCKCRKPKTGMIEEFRRLFPKNHDKELFIGDQATDQICAASLNIPFIKVHKPLSLNNKITAFPELS